MNTTSLRSRRLLGGVLTVSGLFLLAIMWVPVPSGSGGSFAVPNSGIEGYDYATLDRETFQRHIAALEKQYQVTGDWSAAARGANFQVNRVMKHGDQNRIWIGENWLQWLASWGYPPLAELQDAHQILNRRQALCSESCLVLQHELTQLGIPSRIVGLSGHVVLEVLCPEGSGQAESETGIMVDPDFGVSSPIGVKALAISARQNGQDWQKLEQDLMARGFDSDVVANYQMLLASEQDNQFQPVGQPLSPRLYQFAATTRWLSPLLALIGLWLGVRILVKPATSRS